MALNRGVEVDQGGWIVVRWVLAEALVRSVIIDMTHVVMEDGEGVSLVVDQ